MKKTVRTETWRAGAKYLFALLCAFVIGSTSTTNLVAQPATANYIIGVQLNDLTWDYPEADCSVALSFCDGIPLSAESAGDFGFIVAGGAYPLPPDLGPNTGSYVNDYNLGVSLTDIIGLTLINVGNNVAPVLASGFNFSFEAFENDCGDLFQNDTDLFGCAFDIDDSFATYLLNIDYSTVIPVDGSGQPIPGSYPVSFANLAGGDGSFYGMNATVVVQANAPALSNCTLDVVAPDGLGYDCLGTPDPFTGVQQATTSIAIGGGIPPYKIMGSGIYAVGGFNYPGLANGFLAQGAAFGFGLAPPFGISWDPAVLGDTFPFLVNGNQPWQVLVQDAAGCIVAAEGNFDVPNTEFDGVDGGTICQDDPILTLFADANLTNPFAPAFGTFASLPIAAAITNTGPGTATFDPFVAGPGRHTITYCIDFNTDCTACTEKTIYVLPTFTITDVTVTPAVTSICESGNTQTFTPDGIANISAIFTSAGALGLDPGNTINELNDYISWSGPGITDLNNGTGSATFDPSVAGVGTHVINVTVGYTNCPTTYPFNIEVYEDFDPQLGPDIELCQVEGDVLNLIDLLFVFPVSPALDPATDFGGVFTVNGAAIVGAEVTVTGAPGSTQVFNVTYCGGDAALGCEFCDNAVITVQIAPEASWNCNEDLGPIICEGAGTDGTYDMDPALNDPFYVTGGPDLPTPNGCAVSPTPLIELYGAYDLDALNCVDPLIETQTQTLTSPAFAAPGTQSVSVSFTGIPDQAIIENMEISIAYQGTQPTSQGDINSLNVTVGPGGLISVMSWSDAACGPNVGPGNDSDAVGFSDIAGGNDHFGLNNIEDCDAFDSAGDDDDCDNHSGLCGNATDLHGLGLESGFIDPATGLPVPGYLAPDPSNVLDWCDIVRAGGLISNECQGLPFTLTVNSNSANWNITISVTITYTTGEYRARTHEFNDATAGPYQLPLPFDENGDGLVDGDGELAGGVYYQGNGNWTFDATDLEEISEIEIEQVIYGCQLVDGEYCNGIDNQSFWIVESFDPTLQEASACEQDDDCQFDLTEMIAGTFAPGFNYNAGEFTAQFGFPGGAQVPGGPALQTVDYNQFVNGDIFNVCGARDATIAEAQNIANAVCSDAAIADAAEAAAETAYNAAAAASAADPGNAALAVAAADAFNAWTAAIAAAATANANCDAANAIANDSYDMIPVTICYNVGTNPTCGGGEACSLFTIYRQPDAGFSFPETICTGSNYTLTPDEAIDAVSGTLLGIPGITVTVNADGTATISVPASTATGLYTLTHTITNGECSDTYSQEIAVVNTPVAVSTNATVCTNSITNLTQFVNGSSSLGGTFSGSGAAGAAVGGVFLATGTPDSVQVTYTIGQAGTTCSASTTFTVTVVSQANADFDLGSYVCTNQTINLANFLTPATTPGGTFTASAGTVNGNNYTSPGTTQIVYITYTVGTGTCQVSDTEALQVFAPEDVQVEAYGFVCQSGGDDSDVIDLTEYLPDGSGVLNGGTFTMGVVAPFISEIEYDASTNAMEYVEVMAAEGTDLSDYAIYFYRRANSADDTSIGNVDIDGGVNTGKASGRLYGIMLLNYEVGNVPNGVRQPDPLYHTDYRGVIQAQGGTSYNWHPDGEPDGDPIDDVDVISDNSTVAASSGHSYGAVAFDPIIDIQGGPAGVALVNIRQAAWRLGYTNDEFDALSAGDLDFLHFLTREIDWRNNDDVIQFLGYGVDGNTNLGIFSACNGPAATMVSVDLGVVDNGGATRSIQFTNACWQVPNITDAQLDYDDTPPYSGFQDNAAGQSGGTAGNAGVINWGLTEAGADEYYYNYIAPDGDSFDLGRLCWQAFAVGQNIGNNDAHPNGCKFNGYTYAIEENGVDNQPGGLSNLDEEIVHFNCSNPVYTLPFHYQVPATATSCGSEEGTFYLTVMMDIEDSWSAPEEPVCANADAFSLTDLINDDVHYIQPYTRSGSFEASIDTTLEENMPAPYISEIHYDWYHYNGTGNYNEDAADDHCILYNYYSGLSTPNNADDQYNQEWICEGIEISGIAGTDLSCYELTFFTEEQLAGLNSNATGYNVIYVGPDGLLHETDVANNEHMQLYGVIDEDNVDNPDGPIMYVPTFNNYVYNNASAEIDGVPYYAGSIGAPIGANPTQWFGLGNEPADGGLFEDVNGNELYDDGIDTPLDATTFPWERANECGNGAGVGAHWFPIVNVPNNVGGVGLWNHCTGELLEFISWGGQLCVEDKEGFSMATGPFEQLTSHVIDTAQNTTNALGDQRTLQLVHCNQLPASAQTAACGCDDPDNSIWVLVYNGGSFTIPGCGVETGLVESFAYSNSIGYYNCTADENWYNDRYTFTLDLTGADDLPNDAVITSHTVVVTIGTGDASDFQVYTYTVNSGNCNSSTNQTGSTGNWDESDNTNWNSNICDIGDLSSAYTPGEVCANCASVLDNACIPGEFIDAFPYQIGNGGDNNIDFNGQPYGYNFDCNEPFNPSPTDELSAPGIQDLNDGEWETAFFDGNGEDALDNDCYVGECTATAKTTYTVSNLSAYIYEGNVYESLTDTCRDLIITPSTFDVSIRVIINYRQCTPTGNFYTNLDAGAASQYAPSFGNNMTEGPVTLNTEDWDNPFWQLDPAWLYANNIMDVEVNYNTTNYNQIEADNVTDDLACLDDENQTVRQQEITILPGGDASFTQASVSACTGDVVDLSALVTAAGGTFSGTGVSGSSFSSNTAGTFTVTYTVNAGTACADSDQLTVVVEQTGSVNTSGIPTSVCSLSSISLPAASWSGPGVSGNTFTPSGAGSYTLNYSAGSGACGVSGSVTISVLEPLSVSENITLDDCASAGQYTVTLTISGGTGSYTVNGQAIAGNTYIGNYTSGDSYTLVVDDSGVCSSVVATGSADCPAACAAEAGTLSLFQSGLFCAPDGLQAFVSGNNTGAGYAGLFVLTNSNGVVDQTSFDGNFPFVSTSGQYNVWYANICLAGFPGGLPAITPGVTTVAQIAALVAGAPAGAVDLAGPITVDVVNDIEIEVTPVCDNDLGGYILQVRVSGGAPEYNGAGSYGIVPAPTDPFDFFWDAEAEANGYVEGFITNGGAPFNAGQAIAVSVTSDGSLCQAAVSLIIPDVDCGLGAGDDNQFTMADSPINFNVLGNDYGNGIQVINVIQPEHGTVIWDANGNFTYIPNPGFGGNDYVIYEIQNQYGYTSTAVVTLTVGDAGAPLNVVWDRDCINSNTEYTVYVNILGGVAPFTVTGDYNAVFNTNQSFNFTKADGEPFFVSVTDANGDIKVIDENPEACSKVAVTLVSYTGTVQENGNFLKWTTAAEVDNDFFTLEHSTDGVTYKVITNVDGAGTTSLTNNYNFLHTNAPAGISYYRLSTTDFNGNVENHGVVTLVRGQVAFGFVNVYPVPARDVLNVNFNAVANASVRMEVYNVTGQLVAAKDVDATSGINSAAFDVKGFAVGTYFLTINNGNDVVTTKFVVE